MDNAIHPTAIIDATVALGSGNVVGPYCVFTGDVAIGDGNWFGAHCVIGAPAQFSTRKFEFQPGTASGVSIGSRNVIREFTTVHQPSADRTIVEDDCYIMAYNHISHDTVVRSGATLANNCQIGGFSEIGPAATVGLSAILHQYSTIGAYSMVGMGSVVGRDVPPFAKVAGDPLAFLGLNEVGIARNAIDGGLVERLRTIYAAGRLGEAADLHPAIAAFLLRNASTGRRILGTTRRSSSAPA